MLSHPTTRRASLSLKINSHDSHKRHLLFDVCFVLPKKKTQITVSSMAEMHYAGGRHFLYGDASSAVCERVEAGCDQDISQQPLVDQRVLTHFLLLCNDASSLRDGCASTKYLVLFRKYFAKLVTPSSAL